MSDLDSARFAAIVAEDRQQPVRVIERFMRNEPNAHSPWAVMLRAAAFKGLLSMIGIDPSHPDSMTVVQPIAGAGVMFEPELDSSSVRETAPNIAGMLEGTDPTLRRSYVLFAAHFDMGRVLPGRPDSLVPSAESDASGVTSLLALAKAFSRPDARPRHSLVFLVTSGGALGQAGWGSAAFVAKSLQVPNISAVVDVGRLSGTADTGDSLIADGLQDVDFKPSPEWTAAQHSELHVIVAKGDTTESPRAEVLPFMNAGLPTLGFRVRAPVGSATGALAVDAQAERIARFSRFVFYVGKNLADAGDAPRWTPSGRHRLVDVQEP